MAPGPEINVGDEYLYKGELHRITQHQLDVLPRARAVLIHVARGHETITYTDLTAAVEAYDARNVAPLMNIVNHDCVRRKEPSLAAIAVLKATGLPSWGYDDDADQIAKDQRRLYKHWAK